MNTSKSTTTPSTRKIKKKHNFLVYVRNSSTSNWIFFPLGEVRMALGVGLWWVYWLYKDSHQFNHFMEQFQPGFYFISVLPKLRHFNPIKLFLSSKSFGVVCFPNVAFSPLPANWYWQLQGLIHNKYHNLEGEQESKLESICIFFYLLLSYLFNKDMI